MKGFNPIGWLFNFIARIFIDGEKSFLDIISAIIPYGVPVIPAYLMYHNAREQMNFPHEVALVAAIVVEGLGLASVTTAIQFFRNNQRYKDEKNKAPFWVAVAVYGFYILVVMLVNVILEWVSGARSGWVILAIALFMLLGIPAGVLIGIRHQFAKMLEEKDKRYSGGGNNKNEPQQDTPQATGKRTKYASDYKAQIVASLEKEFQATGKVLTPKEITTKFKLEHDNNKGYVSTLTSQWKKDNNIMGFGK